MDDADDQSRCTGSQNSNSHTINDDATIIRCLSQDRQEQLHPTRLLSLGNELEHDHDDNNPQIGNQLKHHHRAACALNATRRQSRCGLKMVKDVRHDCKMRYGYSLTFDPSGENNKTRGIPPKSPPSIDFDGNGMPRAATSIWYTLTVERDQRHREEMMDMYAAANDDADDDDAEDDNDDDDDDDDDMPALVTRDHLYCQ
mmetsp:Transcript_10813/g.12533  ORF Transcript_10813/g.12533 Transcript_10813/m.12533 type:complete len:200 (-) Transcript_10813:271-870(-)